MNKNYKPSILGGLPPLFLVQHPNRSSHKVISLIYSPPKMPVGNEGLGWDLRA